MVILVDPQTPHSLVVYMPEIDRTTLGGTMRLDMRATHFQSGSHWSKLHALYLKSSSMNLPSRAYGFSSGELTPPNGADLRELQTGGEGLRELQTDGEGLIVKERHRHRYEVNPKYVSTLEEHGIMFVGKDETGERMEILELQDHPWFVGLQFHPEYLSRVLRPSRPFLGFLATSAHCLDQVIADFEKDGFVGNFSHFEVL
jgi:CTP synthase